MNVKDIPSIKSSFFFVLLVQAIFTLDSCRIQKNIAEPSRPPIDSSRATIKFQQRKDYNFGDVHFSNRFPAARLNNITQVDDSTFTLSIEPENTPVNPSPWYAFRIWSGTNRNVYLTLNYERSRHRYNPKTSYDGNSWSDIPAVKLSKDSSKAFFSLPLSRDTVTVAAQEIISSAASYRWIDSLAQAGFMQKQVIGFSILGKPIIALNTTESKGKKLVVILSRQHPPEVTGYMAMQSFIRTATSSTDLARRFRRNFELIVIPMVNPDGVDEGNWRHSAAGVDLNRDWELFEQPETKAIRDYLFRIIKSQQATVYFAIDFHSTWYDVFYTNSDTSTHVPGLTKRWLNEFQHSIPGFKANIRPSGNGGNVSKSWMMRALGADALTYEVGDNSSREMLDTKGRIAAEKLMELLLGTGR